MSPVRHASVTLIPIIEYFLTVSEISDGASCVILGDALEKGLEVLGAEYQLIFLVGMYNGNFLS